MLIFDYYNNNETQNDSGYWPTPPTLRDANINEPRSEAPFLANQARTSRIIKFTERRSMRSKETHYIDHPEMGILVRMLPIDR